MCSWEWQNSHFELTATTAGYETNATRGNQFRMLIDKFNEGRAAFTVIPRNVVCFPETVPVSRARLRVLHARRILLAFLSRPFYPALPNFGITLRIFKNPTFDWQSQIRALFKQAYFHVDVLLPCWEGWYRWFPVIGEVLASRTASAKLEQAVPTIARPTSPKMTTLHVAHQRQVEHGRNARFVEPPIEKRNVDQWYLL